MSGYFHDLAANPGGPGEIEKFGRNDQPAPDLTRVRPAMRQIARVGDHELVYNRFSRGYHDRHPGHGYYYLGKYVSDDEALAVWHGWLRSQGVNV